ncbi:MAG: FAD:protein FMN transferase [Candidatus Caldarchaeum sp.]
MSLLALASVLFLGQEGTIPTKKPQTDNDYIPISIQEAPLLLAKSDDVLSDPREKMNTGKAENSVPNETHPREHRMKAPLTLSEPHRFEFSQIHMGTRVRIVLYAHSKDTAERCARSAFARFVELDRLFSDYTIDSELMRLCSSPPGVPTAVSRDVFIVLQRAMEMAHLTDGAFDITAGALTHLWRRARPTGKAPSEEEITSALFRTGWRYVTLDVNRQTVTLHKAGIILDVGGIAKGYACDETLRVISSHGILRALVSAGGDIAVSGPPPNSKGWAVQLPNGTTLFVANCGVSTSGDTEQFIQTGEGRYSHIIDPRTGKALLNQYTITVIAQDAFTSDSLATALSLVPPQSAEGEHLRERFPYQAYIFPRPPNR